MHISQLRCLDGVVGVEGVGRPVIMVVVSMTCYLHFVSYTSTLTAFSVVSLRRRRLGSSVLCWVCNDVCLCTGSVGCIVGDVACGVGGGIWLVGWLQHWQQDWLRDWLRRWQRD
jgi:hypothetical protein